MFKNLKIGTKLLISFIFISILASISGIVSMFVISNSNNQHEYALVNYGFSQGDIGKAMLTVSDNNRCVRDIIGFTNEQDINNAKAELSENLNNYATYVEQVKKTLTSEQEVSQFATIEKALAAYRIKRDEVLALGDTSDPELSAQAQRMAVDQLDPLYDTLYEEWSNLMNLNVTTGNSLNATLVRQGNTSLIVSLLLTIASLVISVILGVSISRGISTPIQKCVNRLKMLSEGDLDTPVPQIDSQDETGMLASGTNVIVSTMKGIIQDLSYGLEEMGKGNFTVESKARQLYVGDFKPLLISLGNIATQLSDTLSQINQSSDQVASGSEQVSSGAQALSQGATEQASSIQELAATINEISNQINENAKNSKLANDANQRSTAELQNCNLQMQNLVEAMNEISTSSNEISRIIKTIDDIAFQTNILALNAAVEAARAGEAGKGFAVVADEVRNLASKSAEAAQTTSKMLEDSVHSVADGTHLAQVAASDLMKVVEYSQNVAQSIRAITDASVSQSDAVEQVAQGIDQISSVVQTNSATAEESAAASQQLTAQAKLLEELVHRFKL